ncbi:molybdenum cofactor guanylyltransferase [Amphibiibacter pelophylacis]|uniref:Molybdenum cofactor guanylyltransferase n=1 Tax=Amphibiibacter pelophylacis TaxID=1799477 RepID=A0ACC6P0Q6_9BURK
MTALSEDPCSDTVLALILAGGQGRRMGGVDKGLQPWKGRALVDAVLDGVGAQTRPVQALAISANRNEGDYARRCTTILPDLRPGWPGPLAGVEAGLHHLGQITSPGTTESRAWLWTLPCDVPQFPPGLLAALLAPPGADATQPRWVRHQGRDHPACALWPLGCAQAVREALEGGRGGVVRLLHALGGVAVNMADGSATDFVNCNTPGDLENSGQRG